MNNRIEWLDSLRGIGIIIVILIHATGNEHVRGVLFNFGVPLFIFVSGYVFNGERYPSWTGFVLNRLKTRIVPYVIWFLILYAVVIMQNSNSLETFLQYLSNFTRSDFLAGLFSGDVNWLSRTVNNGPLWFLPFLFLTENIFFLVRKVSGLVMIGLMVVFISVSMDMLSSAVAGIPALVSMASTHLVTFGAGFIVNKAREQRRLFPDNRIALAALWVVSIVLSIVGGEMFGTGPVTTLVGFAFRYVVTFCGIIAFGMLASYVRGCEGLRFLGAKTLVIFILNEPLRALSCDVFAAVNFGFFDNLFTAHRELFTLIQVMAVLLLSVPCVYLINTYLPFLIGKHARQRSRDRAPV